MKTRRYTYEDVANSSFYQLPKFLLDMKINNDARVLFAILQDRHQLSLKNRWVNEKNEVYFLFTREEMAKTLGCTQPTVRKALRALQEAGLLEEERQGLNKPNLLFLLQPALGAQWTEKSFQSGVKESYTLDRKILSPNNTNNNKDDDVLGEFSQKHRDTEKQKHETQNVGDSLEQSGKKTSIQKDAEEKIVPKKEKEPGWEENIRVLSGLMLNALKIMSESEREAVTQVTLDAAEKANASVLGVEKALRNVSEFGKRKKIKNLQGLVWDSITKKKSKPVIVKKTPLQKKLDITCTNQTDEEKNMDKKYADMYI